MINERLSLNWRPMTENRPVQCGLKPVSRPNQRNIMAGGIAAFLAAVGGTSVVCYWLANRADSRKAKRQSASGDSGGGFDSGNSSSDGSNIFSWFSGDHSSSSDSSGASGDWGGSDGGGGGSDGGGGDGGGGD
jgi:hypothetical protein